MEIHCDTNVRLTRRKASFILVFILQVAACSLWGQVMQKKQLTVADYAKWGSVNLNKINENGHWISYTVSYKNGSDTLFIKNTHSLRTHFFPSGNRGEFISSKYFVYQTAEGLHLFNLENSQQETVSNATRYFYVSTAKRLVILTIDRQKKNTLIIRDIKGALQEHIEGVYNYVIDPKNQMVAYTVKNEQQENRLYLLELLKNNRKKLVCKGNGKFSDLTWHNAGKAMAFMQNMATTGNPDPDLFYYDIEPKKLYRYTSVQMRKSFGDSLSIASSNRKLKISATKSQVFFAVEPKEKPNETNKVSDVQIWNGNAKWVYPMEQKQKAFHKSYLARWSPMNNRDQLISNDSLTQIMLTGDQNYALLSSKKQYEQQEAYDGPRDYYLFDIATGKNTLLLKKQLGNPAYIIPSPGGKYISYFRKNNWWIYDIAKQTHTNITGQIGQPFFHNESELLKNTESYSSLGWTGKDKEIILYDAYDIWAISPDGRYFKRLTKGRETHTTFRWAGNSNLATDQNYDGRIHSIIDLTQGLLLKASSPKGHSGYYKCTSGYNEKILLSEESHLNQLIISDNGKTFAYLEQCYDISPKVMFYKIADKISKTIFSSNPQQQQFYWGKSKLISYENSKGQSLQGALYYPSEYNPEKKYPMIVYIYEKLSQHVHKYINPSQFTGDGLFNITTFTTQGYFVLAPDISYEIGNPGISATDCVVSATEEIIKKGFVLRDKIGLTGHSFGGYETDFIITQTSLFAAAVSGSAATNLSSFYFTLGWNTGKPDLWRFETDQWRMGKSIFDDREGYERNSPIIHAKNITTPLLSWTGDEDKQVSRNQSIEFYIALRRLKKKHIMLLYPGEGHSLDKTINQIDLSTRMHEWFDYHLKDSKAPSWIKRGLK